MFVDLASLLALVQLAVIWAERTYDTVQDPFFSGVFMF